MGKRGFEGLEDPGGQKTVSRGKGGKKVEKNLSPKSEKEELKCPRGK